MRVEAVEIFGFDAVVEFGEQRAAELVHPVGEPDAPADVGDPVDAAGEAGEGVEIVADLLHDAGALHLDRHAPAVAQRRAMDLRQ